MAACVSAAYVRRHLTITALEWSSRLREIVELTRSLQNAIELSHPGGQHRLLTQTIDFRQRSYSLFDVIAKYLTEVVLRAGAAGNHLLNAIRLEEHVVVRLHGVLKRLVGHYLRFSLHESLKAIRYRVEILLSDFLLSLRHVVRLFTVEWIRDASRHEHIELDSSLAFFLLDLMSLGKFGGVFGLFACERR